MAEATPPLADRIREAREKAERWLLDFSGNTPPDEWCLPDLEVLTYLCDHNYDIAALASDVIKVLGGKLADLQYPSSNRSAHMLIFASPSWRSMFFLLSLSPSEPAFRDTELDSRSELHVLGFEDGFVRSLASVRRLEAQSIFPRPELPALLRFSSGRHEVLLHQAQLCLSGLVEGLRRSGAVCWPLSMEQLLRAHHLWPAPLVRVGKHVMSGLLADQLEDGSYPGPFIGGDDEELAVGLAYAGGSDAVGDALATACFARSALVLGGTDSDGLEGALGWLVKNQLFDSELQTGRWPGFVESANGPRGDVITPLATTATAFCLRALAEGMDQLGDTGSARACMESAVRWLADQQDPSGSWQTVDPFPFESGSYIFERDETDVDLPLREAPTRLAPWPAGRIFTQPYETVLILEALEAAAKALRMTWGPGGPPVLKIRSRRTLIWREREVSVSRPAALLVLKKLLERPRETVSYEDLIISAGIHTGPGGGDPAKKQTLRTYVRQLRDAYEKAKSEDDPPRTEFIENIHYEGYRLNLPTTD